MPVDPIELWNTNPFEPVIKDGKIWARGADDDKGQSFMHAKAFETMVKTNTLPCNVKFMLEGEEEIGSGSLAKWIVTNKKLVKADIILVSDTSMIATDVPSINTGLRGLAYWEIEVTGPNADLHSGLFGGSVANPLNALCQMIAKCTDENNHITIPHFYDDVVNCSRRERQLLNMAPYDEKAYKNSLGVKALRGEKGYTKIERVGVRPTFDLCGMWGGYTGEGSKTVLPSKAYAKLSCRLVPNQDHEKIAKLVKNYLERMHRNMSPLRLRLCTADKLTVAQSTCRPTKLPNKPTWTPTASSLSRCAQAAAFRSSPLLNRFWASSPS